MSNRVSVYIFVFIAALYAPFDLLLAVTEVRRAIPISSLDCLQQSSTTDAKEMLGTTGEIEPSQDIRIAPSHVSDSQQLVADHLRVANEHFHHKEFSLAANEYEQFLQLTSPHQADRDQALFRLGECRSKLATGIETKPGQISLLAGASALEKSPHELAAEEVYQQLLAECPEGIFAAGAAYRLGESYQKRKEIIKAIAAFQQAASLCNDPYIINAAHYKEALCYDQQGNETKALELFDEVAHAGGPNGIDAQMAIAQHEEKSGNVEKALQLYEALGKETSATIAPEALVKAGMISYHLGKKEEASQLFHQVTSLAHEGDWGSMAALALMKIACEQKDYLQMVNNSDQALTTTHAERKIEALFLTAQAQRQLGDFKKALALYDQILAEVPTSPLAHDASFMRLLTLHALKDPSLLTQLEIFLKNTTDSPHQTQAQLLKAETLFELGNYQAAAEAYDLLKDKNLTTDLKSDALYKEAWAWNQAGKTKEALLALSTWIERSPQSVQLPGVLMEHGALEQKNGDFLAAIADYTNIIINYPKTAERERALQQKALLHGQLQDNKHMVETFQQLLNEYPHTSAAAQANFWMGWASFEAKEYSAAIPFLEKARMLDSKEHRDLDIEQAQPSLKNARGAQEKPLCHTTSSSTKPTNAGKKSHGYFQERATLRLLLAHYYLQHVDASITEAEALPAASVPLGIAQWVGLKAYEQHQFVLAEKWLSLVTRSNQGDLITSELELALAQTLLQEQKFHDAIAPATKALDLSRDPHSRAEATLALAMIQQGLKNYHQADSLVQETLLLQPEGNINMKARLLLGDLLYAQQDDDGAARAYRAIALLTQDKTLAKQALHKAAEAYRRANNMTEANKAIQECALLEEK